MNPKPQGCASFLYAKLPFCASYILGFHSSVCLLPHPLLYFCYLCIQIAMGQPTSTQRDTSAAASSPSFSSFPFFDEISEFLMAQPTSTQRNTTASASSSSPFSASVAASSSSSSASTSYAPYDVFINHRGPDVKNTFAGFLYRDLKSRGLQVFLDRPELQTGHNIDCQIKAAIEVASVHIAIFSERYAESRWCLEELVLMLNSKGTILPVFNNVKPSDLRWSNKGKYAQPFQQHEEKQRYHRQTIEGWKKALADVADTSGFELDACNGDEVELMDKVVERVLNLVPNPPMVPTPPVYVAEHKIGLQDKLKDFETTVLSQLDGQGRREAQVVGIVGSGGIGKSTLVKEFFNLKKSNYNGSSFLSDVRENAARKSINSLQSQLIKDLRDKDISIQSWEAGVGRLEENLRSCRALIILDDVDHPDQLDAFLPIKCVLDPMSLILITSRDKKVLRRARIAESSIYPLKGLDRPNSLKLFCSHAFFQPHPPPEFEDFVDRFLNVCDGLPLSLKVFGGLLCQENDRSCWEDQLNGIQKLPQDIKVRLKISYDSLEQEEQQIFLDISCFCIGQDKDKWIRIWGGSKWKGSVGLRNLENKCLVEVDDKNKIRTHDHLRDMGRDIAKESMPRRLWDARWEDIYDLLDQSSSSSLIEVRGITISYMSMFTFWEASWEEVSFSDKVFRKLQLLQVVGADVDLVKRILSKVRSPNLIWFCWHYCDCSSLPSCIPMGDLRVLEVTGSFFRGEYKWERLWQQPPVQLRELNIRNAPLLEFPNSLGQLQYLEKIVWKGSTLQTIPDSLGKLTKLKEISLSGCQNLKMLPNCLENLTNLQQINLARCKILEELPNFTKNSTNLREINLAGCEKLKMVPNFFEKLTNLQYINVEGCKSLKVLPKAFWTFVNLQEINLTGCKSLELLPDSIVNLTSLQEINLNDCKSLKVLPNDFETLMNLREINLMGCKSLKLLPDSIVNLTNLQEINLTGCESLKVLPNAFGTLTNLREINLDRCGRLKALPDSIENLSNLQAINLEWCTSLKLLPSSFGNLTNLRQITLSGCESLEVLPNSIQNLTNLQEIHLHFCESLKVLPNAFGTLMNLREINLLGCESLEMLPESIENLTNLQVINLGWCESLEMLPESIENLTNLQVINLEGCESLKLLPSSLGNLTNLQVINLEGCESLEMLPNSIQNLTNLQEIDLSFCESLKVLPNAIWTLKNIQRLSLKRCKSLEVLPNSIENLTSLQKINLAYCDGLKVVPNAFGTLTNLEWINLRRCKSLEMLPNSIKDLRNLLYIDASHCSNLQMPSSFLGNLLRLKHLHLSCCSGVTISNETLGNIVTLECLNLSGCLQMEVLPLQVIQQRSLKKLNLLGTIIKEFPSAPPVWLSNLKDLMLGSPFIKVLPPWLGYLMGLKTLLLHGCPELKSLPDSVGQLSQMRGLAISKCGIQYLPPGIMQLNNLESLVVCNCPLREVPFKRVKGEGEASLLRESIHTAMIQLKHIRLSHTKISEVSFPEGVCPNLRHLQILWCNDLVEVGALPTTLRTMDLRGCGALRKIRGLCALENLQGLDIRGCCALQVEELPGDESVISMDVLRTFLRSLKVLKTPLETYEEAEVEEEQQMTVDLKDGKQIMKDMMWRVSQRFSFCRGCGGTIYR